MSDNDDRAPRDEQDATTEQYPAFQTAAPDRPRRWRRAGLLTGAAVLGLGLVGGTAAFAVNSPTMSPTSSVAGAATTAPTPGGSAPQSSATPVPAPADGMTEPTPPADGARPGAEQTDATGEECGPAAGGPAAGGPREAAPTPPTTDGDAPTPPADGSAPALPAPQVAPPTAGDTAPVPEDTAPPAS